jgi:hypothetical protein
MGGVHKVIRGGRGGGYTDVQNEGGGGGVQNVGGGVKFWGERERERGGGGGGCK